MYIKYPGDRLYCQGESLNELTVSVITNCVILFA